MSFMSWRNLVILNQLVRVRRFSSNGQEIYQRALEALQQVERFQEQREKQKADELHRAIERAQIKEREHAHNPKAKNLTGVTVVKTVVKQTQKDQKGNPLHLEESQWQKQAHDLLTEAAVAHGHPQALILLGNGALQEANRIWQQQPESSSSATQFVQQALGHYERAGENGAPEGWFNLGQLRWTGYPAVEEENINVILPPDTPAAMMAFRKAIDLGDPDAMYFVGVHQLSDDQATDETLQEGLKFIQSAAHMGHGPACYYLALLHLNGNPGLHIPPCPPHEFVLHLNAATETGNADALFLRGHSYHQGDHGYPQDYPSALADFLAAAQGGNPDAAVSAGAMYHRGRPGVPIQQSRAFELYQMAGELGSIEGWRNVAACYALGEGVPKSEATANYIAKTMLQPEPK